MTSQVTRLTVPPNTTRQSPVETVMHIGARKIQALYFVFPPGCRGLVYIRAWSTYHSLTNDWVRGDGEIIPFNVYQTIEDPGEINIQAYNEAVDWEHTLEIRVEYIPERVFYGR